MSYVTHALTGGIYPAEKKTLSTERSIVNAPVPSRIILPLQQHLGLAALPLVNVGDKVLKGEKIAQAQGVVSVPIHASTSGTVLAIESHAVPHASAMTDTCVIIEPDGKDTWIERKPCPDYRSVSTLDLVDMIHEAGIAGLGGAGFPTSIKLKNQTSKIHTLILNGTECEPYITADDMLMREYAKEIIRGLAILAYMVKPQYCLIGIEDNKPEAIRALQLAFTELETELDLPEFRIVTFPTKYPSGGEKQLIQILTGQQIPQGQLPADIGIVCQNVGTAVSVYNAIVKGEPLISRITTFTGNALETPLNMHVLLGTPIDECLMQVGLQEEQLEKLIMGGPMMGFTLNNLSVPVIKTSNCFIAAGKKELPVPPPVMACIRCGICAEACPANLLPQQLYWYAKSKQLDVMEDKFNLLDCIECGACAYVCPSRIPLVQYYRSAKGQLRIQKQNTEKADISRQRFEARTERLLKEKEEKEERRKMRASRSSNDTSTSDSQSEKDRKAKAIQDALARVNAKKQNKLAEPATIDRPSQNNQDK